MLLDLATSTTSPLHSVAHTVDNVERFAINYPGALATLAISYDKNIFQRSLVAPTDAAAAKHNVIIQHWTQGYRGINFTGTPADIAAVITEIAARLEGKIKSVTAVYPV